MSTIQKQHFSHGVSCNDPNIELLKKFCEILKVLWICKIEMKKNSYQILYTKYGLKI